MPIFFVKIDASKKRCRGFSLTLIREIKIHAYAKRQTSDSSWEFLRIENKQIKTVQNNSYV